MHKETFIVNQRELARKVKRTPEHISAIKNRKAGVSFELAATLQDVTGIPAIIWIKGGKARLKKRLNKFFELQKAKRLCSLSE